jgi:toxin-antitoxin system PIN domain toxin
MMRAALLDLNVLVALFDPDHVHHDAAHKWFAAFHKAGWATCPLTENGTVRVLSNPAYGANHEPAEQIVQRLRSFCASGGHVFWPNDISMREASMFHEPLPVGHRQITDVYLLATAKRRGGCLATFDRTIALGAVIGARPEHLVVIPA